MGIKVEETDREYPEFIPDIPKAHVVEPRDQLRAFFPFFGNDSRSNLYDRFLNVFAAAAFIEGERLVQVLISRVEVIEHDVALDREVDVLWQRASRVRKRPKRVESLRHHSYDDPVLFE